MIYINSHVFCVDNTGVYRVKVISIYGNKRRRVAKIGDMVYVVVKSWDRSSGTLVEDKLKKKYKKGSLHRAIVVHTKKKIRRENYTWM